MIISFKYKFIFIKNYKTAGSSIESYLYTYLTNRDIIAPTEDTKGINSWGEFDQKSLLKYFDNNIAQKYINLSLAFFPHMPIWLVKERLKPLSQRLGYDIFNNFYKFAVIRNPYDLIVSDYYWQNNCENTLRTNQSFEQILTDIINNKQSTYRLLNFNRLMDRELKNILCDRIIKFENLNVEINELFKKLNIPFNGKLEIYKKKSKNKKNSKNFYNYKSKKIIKKIFRKEIELFKYDI